MIKISIFVLKGKKLLLFLILSVCILTGLFSFDSMSVFNSGNRNLPVYSVERNDKKVALTFNCAWNDNDIDSILKTLEKYNVKCTFFIVGDWAEKFPSALTKIKEQGHEIGGHSYNHKDYAHLSSEQIKEDLQKCDEAIKNVTGEAPVLYRVPSGSYNNNAISALEKNGKIAIQWSKDSIDYNDASAEDIYNRSIKLEKGGILLMHNGTKNTATALNRVLDNLCGRFEPVPVSELLYSDNFNLDASGRMHSLD